MALKALMLRKKIDLKTKELEKLRASMKDVEKREQELVIAIEEVTDESEQAAVQESVDALIDEKEKLQESVDELDRVIKNLEGELKAEEEAQNTEPPANPAPAGGDNNERSKKPMNTQTREMHAVANLRAYGSMTYQERAAFAAREDVKEFLGTVRGLMGGGKSTRALNNVGLTIPEVMLGLLRENVLRYSKLYRHVTVSSIRGEGRLLISGDIPEAVWTECCANLNELTMSFYEDTFGCWKLGGYFVLCNATREDSDLDLAAEILSTLGQSIGYTDDKTILYGTGVNMPMGIVTRLAQTSQPAGYPATARPWADLHTTNIKTIANTYTGLALFQQIALAAGAAKGKYARGEKVWVMNENTYTFLIAQAMNIDASGAIVSGVNGTMPVLGGIIEVLPDSIIPDYNILMGYYELYRLIERAGEQFASSDQVFFLNDQTVFKGLVRWDGKPVIAEAFVLIGINSTAPTTTVTFAGDGANTPTAILLPATATVAASEKIKLNPAILPYGVTTAITWTSATTAKATVDANGEVTGVAAGTSVITATTANGLTAQCTVTVTA